MTNSYQAKEYEPDNFTFWFNVQESTKKAGEHWAVSEIPLNQIQALYDWALRQDPVENHKGDPSVSLRANLRPKTSPKTGRDYLQMTISDAKPRKNDMPF